MAYDFENMQEQLTELLGDPNTSTDDMFPIAQRKRALNRGCLAFCKDSKSVLEYATGTVANLELAVPSDWVGLFVLIIDDYVITNKRELALADWERFRPYGGSEPYFYIWTFSGTKKMKFKAESGVNGKTYNLYYIKKPTTDLSDDADETIIDDEFREAPAYWAAHRLLKQIGKNALATDAKNEYNRIVAEAQVWIEKQYIDKKYPEPDFGPETDAISTIDRQGHPARGHQHY